MRNRYDANLLPKLRKYAEYASTSSRNRALRELMEKETTRTTPVCGFYRLLRNSHYVDNVDNCRVGTEEIPCRVVSIEIDWRESFASSPCNFVLTGLDRVCDAKSIKSILKRRNVRLSRQLILHPSNIEVILKISHHKIVSIYLGFLVAKFIAKFYRKKEKKMIIIRKELVKT